MAAYYVQVKNALGVRARRETAVFHRRWRESNPATPVGPVLRGTCRVRSVLASSLRIWRFRYVKHYDWDWTGAEQELTRAIELNPSYALARIWYANLLMSRRLFDEARREVRLARELDPFSLVVNTHVGWVLHKARRHDEAVRQPLQSGLDEPPSRTGGGVTCRYTLR